MTDNINLSGWLIGFVSPYMINPDAGNLGAKVGFVFAGLGVPLCIAFYFLIAETKGLTFDEVSSNPDMLQRHYRLTRNHRRLFALSRCHSLTFHFLKSSSIISSATKISADTVNVRSSCIVTNMAF